MPTTFDFAYSFNEGFALIPGLLSMIPSGTISIATYVLTALALYTIARRRGINHPWLSWVPVLNVWILGSLSDQFRYVVKGEDRSKRKALLILNIIAAVLMLAIIVSALVIAGEVVDNVVFRMDWEDMLEEILVPVVVIVALALPLAGVKLAAAILRYIALYDVYTSCDPQNKVLFLVLSVLFNVTEPFFLFFSRNKDGGMPPRRVEPQYQPPQYQEPRNWEYQEPQYQPQPQPQQEAEPQVWEEQNDQ